jgi:hypothetical protein
MRVIRNLAGKKFDCDDSPQSDIFGFVDHTHAARTQLFEDAVVREGPEATTSSGLNVR